VRHPTSQNTRPATLTLCMRVKISRQRLAPRPPELHPLYTIGYGARTLDEFMAALKANHIEYPYRCPHRAILKVQTGVLERTAPISPGARRHSLFVHGWTHSVDNLKTPHVTPMAKWTYDKVRVHHSSRLGIKGSEKPSSNNSRWR
jgi:hypothetical protein